MMRWLENRFTTGNMGEYPVVIQRLIRLHWVRLSRNPCITGPTGCGNTWLACTLGNQVCLQGLAVLYQRIPTLFKQLGACQGHQVPVWIYQSPLSGDEEKRFSTQYAVRIQPVSGTPKTALDRGRSAY